MALTLEMPIVTSNLKVGFGVYGTADPVVAAGATPFPAGAYNAVGSLYFIPAPSQGGNLLLGTSTGYASGLFVRYVKYLSTANPAVATGPAPVYYTDETFTTVSGVASEALGGAGAAPNMVAGWMLPNAGTVANVGVGTTLFTNTILNNGGLGSYVFVACQGFVPSAVSVASTAVGDALIGAAGNFVVARVAAGTAPTNQVLGWALTAVAGGVSDVRAVVPVF